MYTLFRRCSAEYEKEKRNWMENEELQKTERFLEEDHRVGEFYCVSYPPLLFEPDHQSSLQRSTVEERIVLIPCFKLPNRFLGLLRQKTTVELILPRLLTFERLTTSS
jgi:hypothetical protein